MPLFNTDAVLRDEAKAIHGKDLIGKDGKPQQGKELYASLNALNSAALCLSGGGIRSAAFALGVIQALAVHPRPVKDGKLDPEENVGDAASSLLARFDYLSTVSGGGYIGSWLSTWIARTSFADVWHKLVHRVPKAEDEPTQIGWLRAYSNYLTPQLGLTSADTWTAVALYLRNLLLNWLIFAPVLCVGILCVKLIALLALGLGGLETGIENLGLAGAFRESPKTMLLISAVAALGIVLEVKALRFALLNRPTRPLYAPENQVRPEQTSAQTANRGDAQRDESKQAVKRIADQAGFLRHDLKPAVAAAFCFTLVLMSDFSDWLFELPRWQLVVFGSLAGSALYALAWSLALPWPKRDKQRDWKYWFNDFKLWTLSGAVYGAIPGLCIHVYTVYDVGLLIGNADTSLDTRYGLFMLIYGVPWFILARLGAEMVFVGLTSWQIDSDADREWFGRSTGWFTVSAISWLVISFLVLVGADLIFVFYDQVQSYLGRAGSGMLAAATGAITAFVGRSSASAAQGKTKSRGAKLANVVLMITTPLFLITLVMGFSALLDQLLLDGSMLKTTLLSNVPTEPDKDPPASAAENLAWLVGGLAIAFGIAAIASTRVNVNRFSLHALYRNRLIRAFLGATNPGRSPNPFTGFDARDNPPMHSLWHEGADDRPFHVVNIALNVVSSQRLAWQQRKAEPFTVTALHCGSSYQGYRPSREYGAAITLGTAMAISGAAASPNMGYHSSPMVTLLLALFNVRLGGWFGNPGKPGDDTYRNEGPTTAIKPLIDEVFGWATDRNPWVYLSDGGHFENLGLYEMVRRRCRFIVISDAGCDKDYQFEDLGNAVRKIWIDLGIRIHFRGLNALRNRVRRNVQYEPNLPPFFAVGTIDYPSAEGGDSKPGTILYLKPCFHRNRIVNVGVRNYAALNPDFPHEGTGDQFFSESQFESYRALGFEMTDSVLRQAFLGFEIKRETSPDDIFARFKTVEGP